MNNSYNSEDYKKQKEEERNKLYEDLQSGIKNALNSDRYKNFLNIMSRCHNYSYTNSLLISMQRENVTLVKSFTDWKKDRVSINKNEKGIKIFCPIRKTVATYEKDDVGNFILDDKGEKIKTGEQEITSFKVGNVFDISQTNADPEKYSLKIDSKDKILNKDEIIEKLQKASGIKFEFKDSLGRANGAFYPETNEIKIRANMGDIKTISTCVHETAHSILHNKNNNLDLPQKQEEFEAESVAYVVCKALNVNSEENNFLYLANWVGKDDISEFKNSLERIQKASNDILKNFEKEKVKSKDKEQELEY